MDFGSSGTPAHVARYAGAFAVPRFAVKCLSAIPLISGVARQRFHVLRAKCALYGLPAASTPTHLRVACQTWPLADLAPERQIAQAG